MASRRVNCAITMELSHQWGHVSFSLCRSNTEAAYRKDRQHPPFSPSYPTPRKYHPDVDPESWTILVPSLRKIKMNCSLAPSRCKNGQPHSWTALIINLSDSGLVIMASAEQEAAQHQPWRYETIRSEDVERSGGWEEEEGRSSVAVYSK